MGGGGIWQGPRLVTEQCLSPFECDLTPVAGWFVTAGHPLVQKRFYAAVDSSGRLCWTDDPALAEQFPLKADAERFASLACADQDWTITR
jgi:hypothetical protein